VSATNPKWVAAMLVRQVGGDVITSVLSILLTTLETSKALGTSF